MTKPGVEPLIVMQIVIVCVLLTLAGVSIFAIQTLSDAADSMGQGKDVVADILPPPLYVIEAQFVSDDVLHASESERAPLLRKLQSLKNDYDLRNQYWEASTLAPELKRSLLGEQRKQADLLWQQITTRFVPAIQAGDRVAAAAAMRDMRGYYGAHRQAVDATVNVAHQHAADTKNVLSWTSMRATWLLVIVAGLSCLAILGLVIPTLNRLYRGVREANADLERRVTERTAELAAKNRELETFNYSVSHDLKAPLRGIDGYSKLLLSDYADRLDADGRFFIQTIRTATVQMGRLIDDLLAYSRLERRSITLGRVDPRALAEMLVAERADEMRERGVQTTVNIACADVHAEPEGLALALRNLLDNALKFTCHVMEPSVDIGGEVQNGKCVLWVRDNGPGFDMQYHDRIFEIFQRLHRAEEFPGTGVGLAIVRKSMQRMQGKVWAQSELGKGATFFLEIPTMKEEGIA